MWLGRVPVPVLSIHAAWVAGPTQREPSLCRRGRAHHDVARANCQAPPIAALEDLKELDSKKPEVTTLMSEYHGLILKVSSRPLAHWH